MDTRRHLFSVLPEPEATFFDGREVSVELAYALITMHVQDEQKGTYAEVCSLYKEKIGTTMYHDALTQLVVAGFSPKTQKDVLEIRDAVVRATIMDRLRTACRPIPALWTAFNQMKTAHVAAAKQAPGAVLANSTPVRAPIAMSLAQKREQMIGPAVAKAWNEVYAEALTHKKKAPSGPSQRIMSKKNPDVAAAVMAQWHGVFTPAVIADWESFVSL